MLIVGALFTGVCTFLAAGTWDSLVSGGFDATGTQAVRAEDFVRRGLRDGPPDLTLLVDTAERVDAPPAAKAGKVLSQRLRDQPGVISVRSFWDEGSPAMRSANSRQALVTALLEGSENERVATARRVVPLVTKPQHGVSVGAMGPAWTGAQATDDSEHDLLMAELLSAPAILLALIIVFRSVTAALIPLAVAAIAAVATLALLRPLAALMPLSVFTTNLTAALGFGLTVDYCLFLITRYRHEVTTGSPPDQAIRVALRTAGRAAAFSSVTIAAAMSALLYFPIPFLRSMACAGLVVALCAAAASCLLIPPLLVLLGSRITQQDLLARLGPSSSHGPREPWRVGVFWRATARTVTERPAVWAGGALLILTGMLLPAAHLQLGPIDERILPAGAEAHAVAERLHAALPATEGSTLVIADPGNSYVRQPRAWEDYARAWSQAAPDGVITTPHARYRAGNTIGPGDPSLQTSSGTWFSASVPHRPETPAAVSAVQQARTLASPSAKLVGGDAARFTDTRDVLRDGLGPAAAIVIISTAILSFCLTGSVFLPLKAIVVAALSMSACFGAVTWAFQDGHLGSVLGDFTVTGTVNACILLLLFCVAFGLSMDYETFLLTCIQEEYRRSGNNRQAVETGIAETGRLVTVAAIAVATSMASLATSGVTLLKILGFGLTIGVIIDATLVRTILVPASMCLVGRANWWAPSLLRRAHTRFTGIRNLSPASSTAL
ncbi:MMPL family transporter [Streptomyces sp. NPDC051577]|uniref:MMPL family transporter n=1 Tax=Streptomyces sp. NPDC051577 TaxID=3155166 RepID=UPI00343F5BC8